MGLVDLGETRGGCNRKVVCRGENTGHDSLQLAVSVVTWETPIVCYATKSNVI